MTHPYERLPARAFWKTGVADVDLFSIPELYERKFSITGSRIATAGSCFAQHIGRNLRQRRFRFVDVEPAPGLLPPDERPAFGYGLYSARYGNIYSARQLLQLFQRARGDLVPVETVWQRGGRFFDPFRPAIEPDGFVSAQEVETMRRAHLARVAGLLAKTDVFCFTFGLTEAWIDREDGTVFPTCPGVAAGSFDPDRFVFRNFTHAEVMADFEAFIALARGENPNIRFLLTVSPVPLTATASGAHVLPATIYSKSVLRSVAGELAQRYGFVDYFPAYEIIASPSSRAVFLEPNLRSVSAQGVQQVMNAFFQSHPAPPRERGAGKRAPAISAQPEPGDRTSLICEEELLQAFAP